MVALLSRGGSVRRWALSASQQLRPAARASSVVASFRDVHFAYRDDVPILNGASFSVRKGAKVTIMGQNGAGKSSIIKLIEGQLSAQEGMVSVHPGEVVSVARQVMPMEWRDMTILQYFGAQFKDGDHPGPHKLQARIHQALKQIEFNHLVDGQTDRIVRSFSGGQQARLLLAAALITDPSILLLDEPTNNLDAKGIATLTRLIEDTEQTCLVISHDEDFLNSFTDSVIYLDVFTKSVEFYDGDYWFVKEEIEKKRRKDKANNARMEKDVEKKMAMSNKLKDKGGTARKVAKKMRDQAADLKDDIVDVRKEDVALADFRFPFTAPDGGTGPLLAINKLSTRCPETGGVKITPLKYPVALSKGSRLHVVGPNGIGKTTFLELVAQGKAEGVNLAPGSVIGYYRQDFSTLNFDSTCLECLEIAADGDLPEGDIRALAAKFLLKGRVVYQPVKTLSEGQKALLSLACLVLQQPSLLIMDEPSNHVNFRHLPAIAAALRDFQGALILVSHDHHMVDDVGCDAQLDLGQELKQAAAPEPKKKK
ncbi:P-loop containing nucleoside triphosphate hydrolase protein [Pelagophyceae sp. CCMP2097]|nr:P-loop containing nucleoside triphosphate hydrolase protein [Pelagophyceae sp. CCMP2097]